MTARARPGPCKTKGHKMLYSKHFQGSPSHKRCTRCGFEVDLTSRRAALADLLMKRGNLEDIEVED